MVSYPFLVLDFLSDVEQSAFAFVNRVTEGSDLGSDLILDAFQMFDFFFHMLYFLSHGRLVFDSVDGGDGLFA